MGLSNSASNGDAFEILHLTIKQEPDVFYGEIVLYI